MRGPGDPQTPDKNREMSKRRWDGLVRVWRRQLHSYDPPRKESEKTQILEDSKELSISHEDIDLLSE
jgi:hypothetical protein